MKYLLTFLFVIAFIGLSYGQNDQIITTEGDTLTCEITRITGEFIHFAVYDAQTGIILMRSRLPLSGVQSYQQQKESEGDTDTTLTPGEGTKPSSDVPDFFDDIPPPMYRLSINSGFTYQWGGYEGLPSSYKRQMQSLWNMGGEIHYFMSENFGIGLKYDRVITQANEDFTPPISTAFGFTMLRDEKVRFNYFGLSLTGRQFLYDDEIVYYHLSFGNVHYRTDLLGDGVPFFQEGNAFGIDLGIGYDFLFNEFIGIGIDIGIKFSSLNQINDNGVVRPADFNISRIDLTAGIRLFQ